MASPTSTTLPTRTATGMSIEDAVPDLDPTTVSCTLYAPHKPANHN